MPLPIKTGTLMIILAVVMAIISALVLQSMSGKGKPDKHAEAQANIKVAEIIVASHGIPAGSVLTPEDIRVVKWPKDYIPSQGVFYKADIRELMGRATRIDIFPGEPVFAQKLSDDPSRGGMPVVLPEGMRAITLPVDEVTGVGGFIRAGDRVDVLVNYRKEIGTGNDKDEQEYVQTVAQNVLVLALAQEMDKTVANAVPEPKGLSKEEEEGEEEENLSPKEKKKREKEKKEQEKKEQEEKEKAEKKNSKKKGKKDTAASGSGDPSQGQLVSSITLAVTPSEAQALTYADENGDIRFALRPSGDNNWVTLPETSINNFYAGTGTVMGQVSPAFLEELDHAQPPPAPPAATTAPSTGSNGYKVEFYQGTEKQDLNF